MPSTANGVESSPVGSERQTRSAARAEADGVRAALSQTASSQIGRGERGSINKPKSKSKKKRKPKPGSDDPDPISLYRQSVYRKPNR
jgi:hypothetical protein